MEFRCSLDDGGSGVGFMVWDLGRAGFVKFRVRGSRCGSPVTCWLVGSDVVCPKKFSCERSSGELVSESINTDIMGSSVVTGEVVEVVAVVVLIICCRCLDKTSNGRSCGTDL